MVGGQASWAWLPLLWQGQMLRKSRSCGVRALNSSSRSVPQSAGDELGVPTELLAPCWEVTVPGDGRGWQHCPRHGSTEPRTIKWESLG